MIIKIRTQTNKYYKRVKDFCGQIAYGHLDAVERLDGKPEPSVIKKQAHIQKDLVPMLKRQNIDVSDRVKNEIREAIVHAWNAWRETWSIPDTETIHVTFPNEIKDHWEAGTTYYLFPGAYSENKVVTF